MKSESTRATQKRLQRQAVAEARHAIEQRNGNAITAMPHPSTGYWFDKDGNYRSFLRCGMRLGVDRPLAP